MVDKLDLRIPRRTPFTPEFQRLYSELRAMKKGPFRASKLYEYVGDLREYGHSVRLGLFCQMDQVGNHKLEIIDAGTMKQSEILREVASVFSVNPLALAVMRVDFAIDIPDVPLQWFRETVHAQHKRYRAAVTGDAFYSEMGTGTIQTLYFGKRPNLIRIYDKKAEYQAQYRKLIRKLPKDAVPPTFESLFGESNELLHLTRVERQIGGRVPPELETLQNICAERFEYEPFARLKIIDHAALQQHEPNVSFETYCTGMHLRSIAESDRMQALHTFISRHSNGNAGWVMKKYRAFLPGASERSGITSETLQRRFAASLARQMAA